MSLVVTGATLADGSALDFAVVDGRLAEVSDADDSAERVDASGLVALPGLVDLHTHLREPGKEDAETVASGTRAAARGGYTAVFAMPNLTPATDTAEAAQYVAELGRRDGHCEVVPIGAVTKGRDGVELAELGLMAAHGVRVNAIAPGYFRTEMTEVFYQDEAWGKAMLEKIPQRRFGNGEDLVGAVIFLASDASAYITGQCIGIDGGYLASI